MQEVAEGLFAVDGVFHRVEDVVVPEGVDVDQRRNHLVRVHPHQAQEAPVLFFDSIGFRAVPAFAGLDVHQLFLDRVKVQVHYRCKQIVHVHDKPHRYSSFELLP
jgi:hypothetical protein